MNTYTGDIGNIYDLTVEELDRGFDGTVVKPIDTANLSQAARTLLARKGRAQISRNSLCPCGSRKRFKRCCMHESR